MQVEIYGLVGGMETFLLRAYAGDGANLNIRELVVNHDPCGSVHASFDGTPIPICLNDYDAVAIKIEGRTVFTVQL